MIEFTGERVIPGQVDADLWNEHIARYAFAARLAASKRVLDAGCGAGYGAAELAESAALVIGIDVSAEAIAHARANYARPNVAFLPASCAALPLKDGSIDLVAAFEVIEHLADWKRFLREIRRVLAPPGALVISTPNKEYYAESRRDTGPNPFHVHEFDSGEFLAELRQLFPCVITLTENHVEGIGFQEAGSAPDARLELARSRSEAGPAHDSAQVPHFLIAICALKPLPPPAPFFYVPSMANVLREREFHIERLGEWLKELRQEKQNLVEMFRVQKAELEKSNAWARGLDEKLAECARLLDRAEQTVIERTQWAQRLDRELLEARALLGSVRASRWVRLGRKVGLGPDLGKD